MKNQLLLINTSLPAQPVGWKILWCIHPTVSIQENSTGVAVSLPAANMTALSQALFALDELILDCPLVISTVPLAEATLNCIARSSRVIAYLPEPDSGYLSFPAAEQFVSLAKEAIRAHNPVKGKITLEDVWRQVLLKKRRPEAAAEPLMLMPAITYPAGVSSFPERGW